MLLVWKNTQEKLFNSNDRNINISSYRSQKNKIMITIATPNL